MTDDKTPIAANVSDAWAPVRTGMTLRRKLNLLAVPTVLAIVSVPVGIAQAQGTANGRVATVHAVHVTKSAVTHTRVAAKLSVKTAAEPAEAADPTIDPAEMGTDTGHTDEVAGSTTESNVDHQFDGQE